MENFQKWKDIQGSIDGIEKLEEGFRKIELKIRGVLQFNGQGKRGREKRRFKFI